MALILRAGERVAVPWKNGGGITREVAVHPPGSNLDTFDWRVSIAEVHSGGPFSLFAGVDRQMAVLAGRLRLSIEGRDLLTLSPDTPPAAFAGDAQVFAEPMGEPVTDLNVMTRRGRCRSRLSHRVMPGAGQLALCAETTLVIALSQLTLRAQAAEWTLAMLDAAILEGAAHCEVVPHDVGAAEGVSFYLSEISVIRER